MTTHVSLDRIVEYAEGESKNRGFRSMGIYHLIWAVRKLEPTVLEGWLKRYRVEEQPFIKMLETLLRPRRAGGGIPRDRRDGELAEQALTLARRQAAQSNQTPDASHLGEVLARLDEDPIPSLCERFCLECSAPDEAP